MPPQAEPHSTAVPEPRAAQPTKRHRRHANPFTVRHDLTHINLAELFGRRAPLAVDVGCGPGLFCQQLGALHPQYNVLGLEIRPHLVAETEALAQAQGLQHVRCLLANASHHLPPMLPPGEVVFLSVNFPDPWYKKRHHKRRVVDAAWLEAMAPALAPGAYIHAMSDYLPIAQQMREALRDSPAFIDDHPGDAWPETSTTGLTSEREQTHLARGEPIYRMAFRYRGPTF